MLPPPGTAPRSAAGEKLGHDIHDYKPSLEAARALLSQVLVSHPPSDALVQLFYSMSTGKNEEAERARRAAGRPRAIHGELRDLHAASLCCGAMTMSRCRRSAGCCSLTDCRAPSSMCFTTAVTGRSTINPSARIASSAIFCARSNQYR